MSSPPKLSAYVSAFNLIQNGFDVMEAMNRLVSFFDEVVVAVNTSTDETLHWMRGFEVTQQGKVKVVETSFAYTDITFDGAIKNAALQACSRGNVYVQMDLDEFIPMGQYNLWREYAAQLLSNPHVDCFMIPSVDLYGGMDTIRADKGIGVKFRMHKGGLRRGVWKEAWVNGCKNIDTSRSDSCELLTPKDDLAPSLPIVPPQFLAPTTSFLLNGYPFTVHTGYVSFDKRIQVNKAIWAEHWELRSGHREHVATDKKELDNMPLIRHSLKLT